MFSLWNCCWPWWPVDYQVHLVSCTQYLYQWAWSSKLWSHVTTVTAWRLWYLSQSCRSNESCCFNSTDAAGDYVHMTGVSGDEESDTSIITNSAQRAVLWHANVIGLFYINLSAHRTEETEWSEVQRSTFPTFSDVFQDGFNEIPLPAYGEARESKKRFDKWKGKIISRNITSFQDVPDTLHLPKPLRKLETQTAFDARMHAFYIH